MFFKVVDQEARRRTEELLEISVDLTEKTIRLAELCIDLFKRVKELEKRVLHTEGDVIDLVRKMEKLESLSPPPKDT